ncbi:tyrosine-type recombinase/integrase [Lewinella sp. LCG006]|uniref:tyrosine-type recombinase/integrase n=1 Tax=Lewinella sp. LCG006 TaxID=3231911 RepID=UPI003460400A
MARLPIPKFNLRLPKSDTPTLISLVYRYRGKRLMYSTGHSIDPKDWDFNIQRPIVRTHRIELLKLQRLLDELVAHCTSIYLDADHGNISTTDFKKQLEMRLSVRVEVKEVNSTMTFLEFLDYELADMEKGGMKKDTLKMFRQHCRIIQQFAAEYRDGAGFSYDDVDWNLRIELIDWLSLRGVQLAYGNKTLKTLRQFMERARRKKLHNNTSYQGVGWTVSTKKAKGALVFLNVRELQILADLPLQGHLAKIRDVLLIGAGTGQRFSDFSCYTSDNFYETLSGVMLLSLISKKTATPSKVPLNIFPWLIPVLRRNRFQTPRISMQKFNEGVKDLCQLAGFTEKILQVEQYMGRKAGIEKSYTEKYKLVSSHCCRRSFATNLYRMGYSLAQIMPMTGHATESQLRDYIGIDGEMNAEEIALSIVARNRQNAPSEANIRLLGA